MGDPEEETPFVTPFLTCWHCNALNIMEGEDFRSLPSCCGCGRGLHLHIGVHDTGGVVNQTAVRKRIAAAKALIAAAIQRHFRRILAVRYVQNLR